MDDEIQINKERQELLKTTINTVVKRIQEDAKVGKLVAQKQLTYKEAFYDEELAQFTCDPGSLLKGDKCGESSPIIAQASSIIARVATAARSLAWPTLARLRNFAEKSSLAFDNETEL